MIQVRYIYCVLYFYYDYISSTSDHQALDLGRWGPLTACHGKNCVKYKQHKSYHFNHLNYTLDLGRWGPLTACHGKNCVKYKQHKSYHFNHLNYTAEWYLVHSHYCETISTITSRTSSSSQTEMLSH